MAQKNRQNRALTAPFIHRLSPSRRGFDRVSLWIGEIPWMGRNGFSRSTDWILDPLDTAAEHQRFGDGRKVESGAVAKVY